MCLIGYATSLVGGIVFTNIRIYNSYKESRTIHPDPKYPKETFRESESIVKSFPACPVETTLMLISDRWKVLIIRDLLTGTKRFSELKRSVGNISQKVLTANLRSMEESGLLTRKVYPEVPPRVEYTLTETGYSLKPLLDAMVQWGTEYKQKQNKNVGAHL